MKKYILLIILFCGFTAQAQYGYGNGTRQRQRLPQVQEQAKDPDFPIEKYLGIIDYDIKKAAKKSGIKLSSKEGKGFSKILTTYNKDIKDIKRINSFLIKSTKQMVDNFQKAAMASGDFSNQAKIRKKMVENLLPISSTLKEEDLKLDKAIKGLLSEKQYKKWIKYNKKLYKVFPKEEKK